MAMVKGSTLLSRLSYLEEHGEPLDKKRVFDLISPHLVGDLRKTVLANLWYPFELFVELNRALDQVLGSGNLALVRVMGRYAADKMLHTIYKSFTKEGHPMFLFRRASIVWNEFYDSGSLEVIEEGPKKIRLRITGFETPAREHCLSVEGWIEGNVAFSGAGTVHVEEVKCRTRGDASCDFVTTWN